MIMIITITIIINLEVGDPQLGRAASASSLLCALAPRSPNFHHHHHDHGGDHHDGDHHENDDYVVCDDPPHPCSLVV